MTRDEILSNVAVLFGQARIVTTLNTGASLHPVPETILEVRGMRDNAWRPLAKVGLDQTQNPIVATHPRASLDDLRRAAPVFTS
jgi:hypothetical protein